MNNTANNAYLKECFTKLTTFLKQHYKHLSKKTTPWICLLGQEHVGKSTLLKHADCELTSPTQTTEDKILSTQLIDWWVNQNAIIYDTNGTKDWAPLLKLCKKYHGHRPMDHLILAIDCPSLCQKKINHDYLTTLTNQLQLLKNFYPNCPTTIIITQCDRLEGFNEYFADLSPAERQQSFGFNIPSSSKHHFNSALSDFFKDFVKRLGEQLLRNLHREQNLEKRERIQGFPMQMEKLTEILHDFILQMPFDIKSQLKGVYFTSSIKKGVPINLVDTSVENKFSLEKMPGKLNQKVQKSFFIHDLIKDIIKTTPTYTTEPRNQLLRWVSIPITIAIIIGLTFIWHHAYKDNLNLLRNADSYLDKKNKALPKDLKWLAELNNMSDILQHYDSSHLKYYRYLGLPQAAKMQQNTRIAYQNMLKKFFAPYLQQMLTDALINNSDNNFLRYNALKTYLMLLEPEHYDADSIVQWFDQQWRHQYPEKPQLITTLNQHLIAVLNDPTVAWQAKANVIQSAQTSLKELPLANIALLELQAQYPKTNTPILTGPNVIPGLNLKTATIPALYSAADFKKIYVTGIPSIAKNINQQGWVLGVTNNNSMSPQQLKNLTIQIRQLYINNYTSTWLATLNHIRFSAPQNLADIENLIQLITDKQSSLNQLLNIIIGNATLIQAAGAPDPTKDNSFVAIQNLVQKRGNYTQIKQSFDELTAYLNTIADAPDSTKAAYNITIHRYKVNGANDPITNLLALAKQQPTPISNWLNTIANGSWTVILSDTRAYLNNIWATTVLPEYNNNLNNRFPLFTKSDDDISLENFTHFFKPGGTIEVFFNYYIKPLVDINKNYWTWEKLQGQSIGIPQSTLNTFIRASLIQQMFFTDDSNKPTFKFSLSPMSLSKNVNAFTLNLEGQVIQFTKHNHYSNTFTWPGTNPGTVTIRFNTTDGETPTLSTNGTWAWFRTVNQAELSTTDQANTFYITFILDGNTAKFKLTSDNKVSPFIPDILDTFRCPNEL